MFCDIDFDVLFFLWSLAGGAVKGCGYRGDQFQLHHVLHPRLSGRPRSSTVAVIQFDPARFSNWSGDQKMCTEEPEETWIKLGVE